jgi:3-hydroxybutyryl-CoA dehydrogenase
MGSRIAQVCAASGFATVVREVSPEIVDKGLKNIEKNLARLVEKGTITAAAQSEIRGRLRGTTALEDLKDCDLIVEAIIEQLPAKRELFSALDALCHSVHDFCEQHLVTDDYKISRQPSGRSGLWIAFL